MVDGKTAKQIANQNVMQLLNLALMQRGIFIAGRGLFAISTLMTEKEVTLAIGAVEDALTELKPHIKEIWPELVGTLSSP